MADNPPWFDALCEAAFTGGLDGVAAFVKAETARQEFLSALERLQSSPSATTAEIESARAGILALADRPGTPDVAEFTWGESVSWTAPDTVTVPLNYAGRYAADLILRGTEETGVLVAMLTDADGQAQATGCCAKDGIDCVSCMTGRCHECLECVHGPSHDDSARDNEDDTE